jgi:hypothetical protein
MTNHFDRLVGSGDDSSRVTASGGVGVVWIIVAGAAGGRASAAAAAKPASFGRAKSCILLFMWGGPAHQDTWDLKPDAPAGNSRGIPAISTNVPGIQICEHFPRLAQRMDRLCQIRSMTHDNGDHTLSTHYLLTGEPPPRDNGTPRAMAASWGGAFGDGPLARSAAAVCVDAPEAAE